MNQATITVFEQRYQGLLRDFQSGIITEAAFISSAADLHFQDSQGHYWALGLQTGTWYYHDGQTWCPANPRQSAGLDTRFFCKNLVSSVLFRQLPNDEPPPAARARAEALARGGHWLTIPAKSVLVAGIAFLTVLALVVLPAGGAPPLSGPAFAPSPRPPLGEESSGGGGDGDGPQGAITGTVKDLSTGQPGEGIEVVVSGFPPVRTDSNGYYSITGLAAAEYPVSLKLNGQGTPAQGTVYAVVDGQNSTTVDLAYYSQAPPSAAGTPQAKTTPQPPPPPDLPKSGASAAYEVLAIVGIGLLLALTGSILRVWGHPETRFFGPQNRVSLLPTERLRSE
jgi:hypothetical protein